LATTWSLAVEEQFYLILPALIRWVPAKRLNAVLWALILTGPLTRAGVVLCLPASHAMATYWLLPCRWDALFLGVLAAVWTHRQQDQEWVARQLPRFKRLGLAAVAVLAILFVVAPDKKQPLTAVLGFSLIDGFFVVIVVLARFDQRFGRWLSLKPLIWLGSISFGVYLFHLGLLKLLLALFQQSPIVCDGQGLAIMLLAAVGTVALAALSYRFVESPVLLLGRRWHYGGATSLARDRVARKPRKARRPSASAALSPILVQFQGDTWDSPPSTASPGQSVSRRRPETPLPEPAAHLAPHS
jgi:peptidoglycan/LPS O-acetylase OafA/YrhL